jgi:two-component system, chemotaxis family, sensor kinase CheA
MDDLLREFLSETAESLEAVDRELVRFEREPNSTGILDNIFRLVHTIKGTCGFLGLPRLAALTHAAETLLASFRSGRPVSSEAVTLILASIDRVKALLDALEQTGAEPEGEDRDLIDALQAVSQYRENAPAPAGPSADAPAADQPARASIRVQVSTLDRLMAMVSELVLTHNQLIEIGRRRADAEFKSPLQRLSNVTAELQEGVLQTRMQPIASWASPSSLKCTAPSAWPPAPTSTHAWHRSRREFIGSWPIAACARH